MPKPNSPQNRTKWSRDARRTALLMGGLFFAFVLLEFVIHSLYQPALTWEDLSKQKQAIILQLKNTHPIYLPHPYFGYTYMPNLSFTQGGYPLASNDKGFIDRPFPKKRQSPLQVGLFGGSGAMSWGARRSEDRIDSRMEIFLSHFLKNRTEVLNFGVGSHTQYQATQIFLYYKALLTHAIFYVGNNECAQGERFLRNVPIRYPPLDTTAGIVLAEYGIRKRRVIWEEKKQDLERLLTHPLLLRSQLVKVLYSQREKDRTHRLRKLSQEIQDTRAQLVTGPWKIPSEQRFEHARLFPNIGTTEEQIQAMRKALPLLFTEPLLDAQAIAKSRGIPLLVVIQPLPGAREAWKKQADQNAAHQKACYLALRNEIRVLKSNGLRVVDLNQPHWFSKNKKLFLEGVHLTAYGNNRIASILSAHPIFHSPYPLPPS